VTSVQRNLAKGRIANLSHHVATRGIVRSWPRFIHGSLGPHESARKPHLDRFSRLIVLHTSVANKETNIQTYKQIRDHTTCDICRNRPRLHVCYACHA